jgi:hypothetical protein
LRSSRKRTATNIKNNLYKIAGKREPRKFYWWKISEGMYYNLLHRLFCGCNPSIVLLWWLITRVKHILCRRSLRPNFKEIAKFYVCDIRMHKLLNAQKSDARQFATKKKQVAHTSDIHLWGIQHWESTHQRMVGSAWMSGI